MLGKSIHASIVCLEDKMIGRYIGQLANFFKSANVIISIKNDISIDLWN